MQKNIYYGVTIAILVLGTLGVTNYWWWSTYPNSRDVAKNELQWADSATTEANENASTTFADSDQRFEGITTFMGTDELGTDAKLDYGETKEIYDYRFQITNCSAVTGLPSYGSLNVKQGTSIVLENHDNVSHVLAIGTNAHTVDGANYVVTNAPRVDKATGYFITCDGKGAGRLYVYP